MRTVSHPMTQRTFDDFFLEIMECTRKVLHVCMIRFQEEKCEFRRSSLTDSREKCDNIDETFQSFWHGV